MRLFVGIELCLPLRDAAAATAVTLRQRLGSRVDARWVTPDKLHITVRFIGHVREEAEAFVTDALAQPLPIAPFEMRLGRCGAFPRSGPPRVIWIGVSDGAAAVSAIHDELNRRLAPRGFAAEDRPFSAHLTLARVREVSRGVSSDVRRTIAALTVDAGSCPVTSATLFESRLSPAGSRYERLARIPLVP
jgi:2'-5' RNA ligase